MGRLGGGLFAIGIGGLLAFSCKSEGSTVLSAAGADAGQASAGSGGDAGSPAGDVEQASDAGSGNEAGSGASDAGLAGSGGGPLGGADAGNPVVVEYVDTLDAQGDWQFDVNPDGEDATGEIADGSLLLNASQLHSCPRAAASLALPQLAPLGADELVTWKLALVGLDASASGRAEIVLRREPLEVTIAVLDPNFADFTSIATAGELLVTANAQGLLSVAFDGMPVENLAPVQNLQSSPYTGPASVALSVEACGADFFASATMSLSKLEISTQPEP